MFCKWWNRLYLLPNLSIDFLGILLDPALPFLGASPDRLIITKEGDVIPLEVKCPLNWHNNKPVDYINDKNQFVRKGAGHEYYFQMQMQMLFCKACLSIFCLFYIKHVYLCFAVFFRHTLQVK